MRQLLVFPLLLAFVSAGYAQVGPAAARVISRPMPSKAPSGQTFNAEAELLVDRKGRVDRVDILSGSGDEAFDKQWRKSLSDWRFVPAVGADGEPAEGIVRTTYKNTGGVAVLPIIPGGTTPTAARSVLEESERLERLSCKDFLWEYQFVIDALPRRLALLDPLLKTPQVMLTAELRLTAEQQATLRDRYDQLVSDAARQCRDTPDGPFWSGTLKPLLQGAL